MSNMYGPKRIVFHKKRTAYKLGSIAMCGGGSYHPMGHYKVDALGRIELYMIDDPFQVMPNRPISFIGFADNKVQAKRMILTACQKNPDHCMSKKEYINANGEVEPEAIETATMRNNLKALGKALAKEMRIS